MTFCHARGILGFRCGIVRTYPQGGLHGATNDGHGLRPRIDRRPGLCGNGDNGGPEKKQPWTSIAPSHLEDNPRRRAYVG